MWVFTKWGFFSIVCAQGADGALDPDMLMIRARVVDHLENLLREFSLSGPVIVTMDTDYAYRIVLPKTTVVAIMLHLTEDITYSNFKNEVALNRRAVGTLYVQALHDVWETMYLLQRQTLKMLKTGRQVSAQLVRLTKRAK